MRDINANILIIYRIQQNQLGFLQKIKRKTYCISFFQFGTVQCCIKGLFSTPFNRQYFLMMCN